MSDDFDFDEGDHVLVRIREDGQLVAKFTAKVHGFREVPKGRSDIVQLDPAWPRIGYLGLVKTDAEFEVIDDPLEVNF